MKLVNFSQEMEGRWTGATWPEENSTEVVMQQNVTKLQVSLSEGHQVEGEDITVTCTVEGGSPPPSVQFLLVAADNQTSLGNSSERFTNITELSPEGKVLTVSALLRLSKEDQGWHVGCRAEQWDNSQPRVSLASKEEV